jgi:mRNA-degrading endonuclease toxin of MazEF toxin-antitoxin module
MAEGIKLKRGLIIEVNLDPTRGSETGKIRPCIIVTNNTYNEFPEFRWFHLLLGVKKKPRLEVMWRLNLQKQMD